MNQFLSVNNNSFDHHQKANPKFNPKQEGLLTGSDVIAAYKKATKTVLSSETVFLKRSMVQGRKNDLSNTINDLFTKLCLKAAMPRVKIFSE